MANLRDTLMKKIADAVDDALKETLLGEVRSPAARKVNAAASSPDVWDPASKLTRRPPAWVISQTGGLTEKKKIQAKFPGHVFKKDSPPAKK